MRIISTFLMVAFLMISSSTLVAQVVSQRTSDLMPELYSISGDAFLEEMSNGSLQLRLSDDFTTPPGPDVRILLGNSLSLNGTVEIVNLSDIGHFDGARTFAVPASVNIDDFNFILFFCVQFQQFWASGTWDTVVNPGGGNTATCESATINIANGGGNNLDICPTDGVSDIVTLENSLDESTETFAYLITDANGVLQSVVNGSSYDFEGSSSDTEIIYGIHYDGDLNPVIGANRMQTTASGCFEHTNNFIVVSKNAECVTTFECSETLTATTDWAVSVDVCPNDGQDDIIPLLNNLFIPPGTNYAFLITDANEVVEEVVLTGEYNFEGSSDTQQRVYGIHYDGTLNAVVGQHRMMTTASGCFIHSGANLFLTISKQACSDIVECQETVTGTTNWVTEIDICSNDGTADMVTLLNNLFIPVGENYAFLVTDANEVLQEVLLESTYNFEATGLQEQRVYGLSYDGTLVPAIGENRKNTTASECFIHSSDDLFIRINKTAGCALSTEDAFLSNEIEVFPNPTDGLFSIEYGDASIDQIEIYNSNGQLIQTSNEQRSQLEISNSGIYLVRFISDESSTVKRVFVLD